MSIGGSGYLCCGRGRNLIASSERSQRTWLDLEPLLMFFICVVMTFLLTEIIPISFHVHRSLEIHAPVTTTDCWLHFTNSEKEHNMLTLEKVKSSAHLFLRRMVFLFITTSWFQLIKFCCNLKLAFQELKLFFHNLWNTRINYNKYQEQ